MNLPAYPSYKTSDAEWFGDIPEHWAVRKLKYVAKAKFSNVDKHTVHGEEPVRLCNYVDVYYNEYIREGLDFMAATASQVEIARFSLKPGDTIITKDSESWDDIAVPAYVPDELPGVVCGYHLAQIGPIPDLLDGKFLFRAFCSNVINHQFRIASTGVTRYGLGKYGLDNSMVAVPRLEEQQAIAKFLDRETRRIDGLIEKKRRQIELLQEKRSALISHTVTKGLDPSAQMKDSGIEWLGEVPAHWEIVRIKHCCRLESGHTPSKSEPMYWLEDECTIPWVSLKDTKTLESCDKIEATHTRISVLGMANSSAHLIPAGAVVFNRDGARVGLTAILAKPMAVSQHIIAWVCGRAIDNKYLLYVFYAMKQEIYRVTAGSTIPTIGMPDVGRMVTPVPRIHEQQEIVLHLDSQRTRLNSLVEKISDSIKLLREYRSALISAAVTGKVDVRGEVPCESEIRSLLTFCEICDKIKNCRFIRTFDEQDHTLKNYQDEDGNWQFEHPNYDDDDFRSFMTHFRKLFLQNEQGVKTDIYSIIKILSKYGTKKDRDELKRIRTIINDEKKGMIVFNVEIDGEKRRLGPADIMNIIVNGEIFHSDTKLKPAVNAYQEWGVFMQMSFLRFAMCVVNNAVSMSKVIRKRYDLSL